jgi:prepilin-type N-terminal cleavage/methylation domain-containing protein
MKIFSIQQHHERGFTLIEALVAITILTLSIAGPMVTATNGIKNSVYASDQIVAFYIAQEGVEIIRSLRDGNALNNVAWQTGISSFSACTDGSGQGCGIDIRNKNFINCSSGGGTACNIYYDPLGLTAGSGVRGVYSHVSSGSQTIFKRSIKIVAINTQESTIDVTVTWISRGVTKTITVQSRLFNQYDNLGPVSYAHTGPQLAVASTFISL